MTSTDDHCRRQEEQFVEETGIFFERLGAPRMAGRVLGRLFISEPLSQSLDDLAEVLQASKGSISTVTRLLIQYGMIERVGKRGERRDYFRIAPDLWANILRRRIGAIVEFGNLAQRGLKLLRHEDAETRQFLEEAMKYCDFIEKELSLIVERWEQVRKS